MKLLELHIIINHALSCLNRDENGSPKAMTFGGTPRARISSQSLKRAIREYLKDIDKEHFGGIRTRSIGTLLSKLLEERGIPQELSYQLSDAVANLLGTTEKEKTKTILFFSDQELIAMADKIASSYEKKNLESLFKISVKKNDKKKDNKKKNDKKKSEKNEN